MFSALLAAATAAPAAAKAAAPAVRATGIPVTLPRGFSFDTTVGYRNATGPLVVK